MVLFDICYLPIILCQKCIEVSGPHHAFFCKGSFLQKYGAIPKRQTVQFCRNFPLNAVSCFTYIFFIRNKFYSFSLFESLINIITVIHYFVLFVIIACSSDEIMFS